MSEATARGPVRVRQGAAEDLPAIAAIYTHYVLKTTITFNTAVKTPREWQDRYEANVVHGPYDLFVAERDGGVIGYVETSEFRPKPAYGRTCEVTIYAAPDQGGAGVGSALFDRLFETIDRTRFHRAISIIALPNDASVRFHQRYGFVHRGTLTEVGHKFGRYLDVAFYEKSLDDDR